MDRPCITTAAVIGFACIQSVCIVLLCAIWMEGSLEIQRNFSLTNLESRKVLFQAPDEIVQSRRHKIWKRKAHHIQHNLTTYKSKRGMLKVKFAKNSKKNHNVSASVGLSNHSRFEHWKTPPSKTAAELVNKADDKNSKGLEKSGTILEGCRAELFRNLTLFSDSIKWTRRQDPSGQGKWSLEITNCDLKQINIRKARECISQTSPRGIQFIGDSVTRYQYLNLAHFLATGRWNSPRHRPNENANLFLGGWREFHFVTNARMRGYEICDCYRVPVPSGESLENRYFSDPSSGVKLSFITLFGSSHPFRIHKMNLFNRSCHSNVRTRKQARKKPCKQRFCSPGTCSAGPLAKSSTNHNLHYFAGGINQAGALSSIVALTAPSDVVINAGLHWYSKQSKVNTFATKARVKFLKKEIVRLRESGLDTKMHWKMISSSSKLERKPEYGFAEALVRSAGFVGIYDLWSLTSQLRSLARAKGVENEVSFDGTHFQPEIYPELNKVLIAYLCSSH